jgi:hypothetical protein
MDKVTINYFKKVINDCTIPSQMVIALNYIGNRGKSKVFKPHIHMNDSIKYEVLQKVNDAILADVVSSTTDVTILRKIVSSCNSRALTNFAFSRSYTEDFYEAYLLKCGIIPNITMDMIPGIYRKIFDLVDDNNGTRTRLERAIIQSDVSVLSALYDCVKWIEIDYELLPIINLIKKMCHRDMSDTFVEFALKADYENLYKLIKEHDDITFSDEQIEKMMSNCSALITDVIVTYIYK